MNRHKLDATRVHQPIVSGGLRLGGTNPGGDTLTFNSYYPELNGKPYFPICGEFHFSRFPRSDWEEALI